MICIPHRHFSSGKLSNNERVERGHVACMERKEMHTDFWWEIPRKFVLEDIYVDKRIILKWMFKE
jgi:hypothetical protein